MLDFGSGVAGGARGWVTGREGVWGVPLTWVWVVGFSPQILEHPTSICDTGVNYLLKNSCAVVLNHQKNVNHGEINLITVGLLLHFF